MTIISVDNKNFSSINEDQSLLIDPKYFKREMAKKGYTLLYLFFIYL
jgi:hypothetical protein